jgi:hypothetical protein
LKFPDFVEAKVTAKLKSGSFSADENPGLVMLISFKKNK